MEIMLQTGMQKHWDEMAQKVQDETWPDWALARPATIDDLALLRLEHGPHRLSFDSLQDALRFIWALALKYLIQEQWLTRVDQDHVVWHGGGTDIKITLS